MDVITHAGGIWAAEGQPDGAPGMSNPDWRLIIKRGNDGKNGQMASRVPWSTRATPAATRKIACGAGRTPVGYL